MDLSNLSDKDVLRTAEYLVDSTTPGGIKQTVLEAQDELSARRTKAKTHLWEVRLELQHAENAVRRLNGFAEKEVHGVSGDLSPFEESHGA